MTAGARRAKLYDLAGAIPLILWLGLGILGSFLKTLQMLDSRGDGLAICSQIAIIFFLGLVIVFLVIRRPPVLKAKGLAPKLAAVVGCLLPFLVLALPRTSLTPLMTAVSSAIVFLGTSASIFVVFWLGRSFSILPQARGLMTEGPYRVVRHPLYLAELGIVFGRIWELDQPWPLIVMIVAVGAQIPRMHFEEKVLSEAFPTYREYASRTARLIPGLY